MESKLPLEILGQPNDTTCGPSCLHAVYRYYGDPISLTRVIEEVDLLETGGTLAVFLATHALRLGYRATIYTYNLHLFDPTWFDTPAVDLADCLRRQAAVKPDRKLRRATRAYLEYLSLGGRMRFEELTPDLLRRHLEKGRPLLTGLNATYLYHTARETGDHVLEDDDIGGEPTGHFVVVYGFDSSRRVVFVADPLGDNPPFGSHYYAVSTHRLLGAVLLGIVTYDANILVLEPPAERAHT
jgi:hypothetical protein